MANTNSLFVLLTVAAGALTLAACDDEAGALKGRRGVSDGDDTNLSEEALRCTEAPQGRSYTLFDGSKLEALRVDENGAINRARFKPYSVMAGEYQRVLGVVPKSLAAAGPSFDAPPERWYAEPSHSGVSVNASFAISFEACNAYVAGKAQFAAAPDANTAGKYCAETMRKAWSRSPTPDETAACVDLATTKLDEEPDARRKWSYVCASILSSSHFLTY